MDVRDPVEAALVTAAFLVCHHCDEDVVRMNPRVFDVVSVGQAADDVFGGVDASPLRVGGSEGCGGGSVRVVIWVDDSYFGSAEFAKIADECGKWHSLAFAVGALAQQECFPDSAVFEELRGKMFATESGSIDEVDDSVEFSLTCGGGGGGGGCLGSKYNVVDFLDGAQ